MLRHYFDISFAISILMLADAAIAARLPLHGATRLFSC